MTDRMRKKPQDTELQRSYISLTKAFLVALNIFYFRTLNLGWVIGSNREMKTLITRTAFLLSFCFSLLQSCKKTETPDPCAGVNYTIEFSKSESVGSSNNGTITVTYPVGDTIQYSLNNGSFQASRFFTNLIPGNYIITVKNQKGCTDTTQTTILNYGPKYALVKQLINA